MADEDNGNNFEDIFGYHDIAELDKLENLRFEHEKLKLELSINDSKRKKDLHGKVIVYRHEEDNRKQQGIAELVGEQGLRVRYRIIGDTIAVSGCRDYFWENIIGGVEGTDIGAEEHMKKYNVLIQKVKKWVQNN